MKLEGKSALEVWQMFPPQGYLIGDEIVDVSMAEAYEKVGGTNSTRKNPDAPKPFSITMKEGTVYMITDGVEKKIDINLIRKEVRRALKKLPKTIKYHRYLSFWKIELSAPDAKAKLDGLVQDMENAARGMSGWLKIRVDRWAKLLGYIKMFTNVKQGKKK